MNKNANYWKMSKDSTFKTGFKNMILTQMSLWHKGVKFVMCLGFLILLSPLASAQSFTKTFSIQSESSILQITGQYGSITINSSASTDEKVTIKADQSAVNAVKMSDGTIKVNVSGRHPVNLEITSPPSVNLNLLMYKGTISVHNTTGSVKARISTEGNILLSGIKSSKVEADSMRGNISYNGDVLTNGHYTLKSVSGKIDITLPSNSDFKLSASCFNGAIDFGGFKLSIEKQSKGTTLAIHGTGKAEIILWTQDGSLNLHKKM